MSAATAVPRPALKPQACIRSVHRLLLWHSRLCLLLQMEIRGGLIAPGLAAAGLLAALLLLRALLRNLDLKRRMAAIAAAASTAGDAPPRVPPTVAGLPLLGSALALGSGGAAFLRQCRKQVRFGCIHLIAMK